jgi:hypothetical protein
VSVQSSAVRPIAPEDAIDEESRTEDAMTEHRRLWGGKGPFIDRAKHEAGLRFRRDGDTAHTKQVLAAGMAIALVTGCLAAAHDASHDSASATLQSTGLPATSGDEAAYLAENDAAMKKMMVDMSIKATGDVDADFVGMMVPHHQGAVDMARTELRYGHNEQLRRIAQEIIVEQMQEITAMHLALGHPLPPSIASPTQPPAVAGTGERPMAHGSMKMPHDSTMMKQEH